MAFSGLYYQLAFKNADKKFNTIVDGQASYLPDHQTIYVRIYDLTLEDDTTFAHEIIEIEGSGDPLHLSTADNSEDKFTGVKPIQATIKFISSNKVKLSSFVNAPIRSDGVDVGDPRWRVEIYYTAYLPENIIFKGFLNLDDCYEDFLPEKNEVVLVANDGLAGLRNIPLTDFNGNNPVGFNRIADFIAWSLFKTGLELSIKAVFNIREKDNSTKHFFDAVYLHSKTFEDKIGTCISCYDVLEKILSEEAFITQRNGEWWIIRVDELIANNPAFAAKFNSDGTFDSIDSGHYYPKFVGPFEYMFFSQEQTTVHPQRPHKYIKESFKFEYPQEIIDNIDFSRGTEITTLPTPPVVIDGQTCYQSKFTIDNWIPRQVATGTYAGTGASSPSTTNNYIRKIYTDVNKTYEKERYVVIEGKSPAAGFFIQSGRLEVHKNDKFDISVDTKFAQDVFPSTGNYRITTMLVRLTGNNGSYYLLHGGSDTEPTPEWRVVSGSFTGAGGTFIIMGNYSEDMTGWKTCTFITDSDKEFPCPPIPTDGFIDILLVHGTNANLTDRYFNNLKFTYIPFINGGYSKYSTYYFKVSNSGKFVNKRENQVYISDSPKKLLKGSLYKESGWSTFVTSQTAFVAADKKIVLSIPTGDVRGFFPVGSKFKVAATSANNNVFTVVSTDFVSGSTIIYVAETVNTEGGIPTASFQSATFALANKFYAWNDIPTTTPDDIYLHPYGHLQAYDVWNQYRSDYNKLQFTAQGLDGHLLDETGNVNHPHLIHSYYMNYSDENTDNRIFMLLTFDINFYSCEWRGTFAEVYNSVKGKNYEDALETKYEQ